MFPAGTTLFYGLTTYGAQPDDTLQSVADSFAITVEDLGARNALAGLASGQTLAIPYLVDTRDVATSTYRADGSETFAGIVAKFAAWQSDPSAGLAAFVTLNRYVPALFDTTTPIVIGTTKVTPTTASTFDLLATEFGLDVQAFATKIAGEAGHVRKDATVYAVAMTTIAGETFAAAAARYNATVTELADANASVYQLIAPGATVSAGGFQATVGQADTFTSLAARINAARTAAAPPLPPTVTPADVAAGTWSPALNVGAATLLPPVRGASATAAVTPRYDAPIAPVHVTATLSRDTGLVDPEFAASSPVWTAATPLTAKPFAPDAVSDDPLFSLRAFATQFEAAFPGFKLATGADADYAAGAERAACGSVVSTRSQRLTATAAPAAAGDPDPLSNRQLWAVNLGKNGAASARFNYTVAREDVQFFAIPPLATSLWDSGDLTVQSYVSGTGLTGGSVRRFRSAEPDQWASTFLAALDGLLAPEVTVALYRFDPAAFASIVGAKNTLASAIKTELLPIFALPQGAAVADTSLSSAQEALYQQLLVELGSAYATNVLVQYPFTVASGCTDPDVAARLSGKPVAAVYRTAASGAVAPADVAAALGVSLAYLVGSGAPPAGGVISATPFLVGIGIPTSFGGQSYTTTNADTLDSLATTYAQLLGHGVTVLELVNGIDTGGQGLLRNGTAINVTRTVRPLRAGATLASIADSCGGTVIELAQANSGVPNVFVPGSALALPGLKAGTVPSDGSFAGVAQALGASLVDLATALWTADVTGSGGYTLDTGANTVLTVLRVPPPYTFTTAKLPLAQGSQYATFLFDAKDAALNRAVFLDLDYAITEMEYDIVEDQNALGAYQASSWLTFVLAIEQPDPAVFPDDAYLGPVEIPLPLRAYPEPFVLANPAAIYTKPQTALGATDDTLFEWAYAFDATRTMAAQDSAELHVAFNVPDGANSPAPMMLATRTALFEALAAFAYVYPDVARDLDELRQPVPNAPVLSGALSAFTTLMNGIVTAWNAKTVARFAAMGGGDLYRYGIQTLVNETTQNEYGYLLLDALEGPADFAFTVPSSCAADLNAGKLDAVRQPFADAGYPLSNGALLQQPYTSPWTIVDTENTFTLTASTAAIVVARTFLWPALGTPQTPALPARQLGASMLYTFAQPIDQPAQLHFAFERVQVIGKQNALAGLAVTRNADLVASRRTADAFVYQTPMTSFPNPTNPYKIVSDQVDLTGYLDGKQGLANALSGFFDTVFASQIAAGSTGTRQISLTAVYAYALTDRAHRLRPAGGQVPARAGAAVRLPGRERDELRAAVRVVRRAAGGPGRDHRQRGLVRVRVHRLLVARHGHGEPPAADLREPRLPARERPLMPSRRDFLAAAALGAAPPAFPDTGPLLAAPHRHRIAFGFTRVADGAGLGQMKNALNAYEFSRREGPGTAHVLGVFYGSAVALALGDAAWRTYRIGRALQLRGDAVSRTGAAARNPFARGTPDASVADAEDPRSAAQDASLAGLMRRGASFFVCNNALTGFARALVTDAGVREPVDRVLGALRAALLPGTVLVPAGVAALADAQEARYAYVAV